MKPISMGYPVICVALILTICTMAFVSGPKPEGPEAFTGPSQFGPEAFTGPSQVDPEAFTGRWQLDPTFSTPVDPWSRLRLELTVGGDQATIRRIWSTSREHSVDSLTVPLNGTRVTRPIDRWVDERHLAVYLEDDATRQVTASLIDAGRTIRVEQHYTVNTSQGTSPMRIYTEYRLGPDGTTLSVLELRSTRPLPIHYRFTRDDESP